MPGRRIAAFDFDGTLTRRDTLLPFLVHVGGAQRVARAVAAAAPVAARARLGRLEAELHHRDAVKARLLAELFAGRDPDELAEAGRSYARTLPGRLRPAMAAQLAWHRQVGHELVIVSASLGAYLRPFGETEGLHHVIAVELEVGADGRLTGAMEGPNVRGPEKEIRLRAWLAGDVPDLLWGYGNSSGDVELLGMADVPVWVDRRSHVAPAV